MFGHGGDSADVIDWTAFSPAMVDVGIADGIFAAGFGWLRVRQAAIDSTGLRFTADTKDPAPATLEDLQILRRARGYFTDATRWNRIDTRRSAIVACPAAPAARTLFCAFYVASNEIAGEFFVWRPAGAALQAAIRTVSPRRYQHPLTDFNNDSLVSFAQVQEVLDDAIRRVESAVPRR